MANRVTKKCAHPTCGMCLMEKNTVEKSVVTQAGRLGNRVSMRPCGVSANGWAICGLKCR
jgi:hypothetical protein